MLYAYTENFILPFSHDEVVHGKGSLLDKMPGDVVAEARDAARAVRLHVRRIPGKKLLFMGDEFGQWREWNHDRSLDWHLLDDPAHAGLHALRAGSELALSSGAGAARSAISIRPASAGSTATTTRTASCRSCATRAIARDFVVMVFNFTPVPRRGYRIGVPAGRPLRRDPQQRQRRSTAAATSATAAASTPSRSPRTASTSRCASPSRRSAACYLKRQ